MNARILLAILTTLLGLHAGGAHAAARMLALTPINTSVFGAEYQDYTVRLLDAGGVPVVGETVTFFNDACGYFQNGLLTIGVASDANGEATATFRARAQGIACTITASAGASVRFNVFTYIATQINFEYRTLPENPLPGEDYSLQVRALSGIYPIYAAQINVQVIPGFGTAIIKPLTANSGTGGRVEFEVRPGIFGDYKIELEFRGIKQLIAMQGPVNPLTDLWWGGFVQNGWGMSVVQHEDRLFTVIYAYDNAGKPTWFVMPGGEWNDERTMYSGNLYRPTGTPYTAYDATRWQVNAPVGTATLTFTSVNSAVFDYKIDAFYGRKLITRQPFGPVNANPPLAGLSDMWWGGIAQNGWGVAIIQQYASLFSVWFTYDAAGAPTWFVMPAGGWSTPTTYEGRLYRTTGAPWVGYAYDPAQLQVIDIGSFRLRFDGGTAGFDYTIDGVGATLPLVRQPF